MEERNYKLYEHISPSNKRYYGITCQKVEDRWSNGNGYKYNEHFTRAINKYGWENFEHSILFNNLTIDEANLLEQMYISLYDTANPKYGYNNNYGGGSGIPNEQTRYKMSISGKIGQNRPDVKKRKSERTKGEKNPMYGKRGAQNPNSKSILMLDFNGNIIQEFACIRLANEFLNKDCSINNISRACIKKHGTAYGYFWLFKEDYINMVNNNNFNEWVAQNYDRHINKSYFKTLKMSAKCKTVYQLDKNSLQIVNSFNSVKEASINTGINEQGIRRTCRHGCNTAGGYSWIYQCEYHKLTIQELKELYKHKYKPVDKKYYVKNMKKVKCIELNLIFNGVVEANEYLEKPRKSDNISQCARGKKPTAWGYHWEYVTEEQAV